MTELLFGTTNVAKFNTVASVASLFGIQLRMVESNIEVEETGDNIYDNAEIKAKEYYSLYKKPVLSQDMGIYLYGVDSRDQPGACIRRVNGTRLTDTELIDHYIELSKMYHGLIARYYCALCIVTKSMIIKSKKDEIISEPFLIVDQKHSEVSTGFPLDSLSMSISKEKYFYDLDSRSLEKFRGMNNGYYRFFDRIREIIGV